MLSLQKKTQVKDEEMVKDIDPSSEQTEEMREVKKLAMELPNVGASTGESTRTAEVVKFFEEARESVTKAWQNLHKAQIDDRLRAHFRKRIHGVTLALEFLLLIYIRWREWDEKDFEAYEDYLERTQYSLLDSLTGIELSVAMFLKEGFFKRLLRLTQETDGRYLLNMYADSVHKEVKDMVKEWPIDDETESGKRETLMKRFEAEFVPHEPQKIGGAAEVSRA